MKSEMCLSFEEARKMCEVRFHVHHDQWQEVLFDHGQLDFESPILPVSPAWDEYKNTPIKELIHTMVSWDDYNQETLLHHDLIPVLQKKAGTENIANVVMDNTDKGCDIKQISQIINLSMWSGISSRKELVATFNQWLKELDDERKVYVALHSFFFPGTGPEEMLTILRNVAHKFPNLSARCDEIKSLHEQQKK